MGLEKWVQKKHCKKHTHKKKQKPKHHKYTKHMYNYSIAMKLPLVPASPLLPLLLLPTIVGSPVTSNPPLTLWKIYWNNAELLRQFVSVQRKCAHTYLPVFPNLHDPPHFLFFLPCTSPQPHELSAAHVHVCRAFLFYRESLHCRMLSRPARLALHVTPVNGILRSSSAVRWGILRRFLVTTISAAAAEHVQTAFATLVAETTAAEREDAVQFISANQKPGS